MICDNSILMHFGGLERNSLNHVLHQNNDDDLDNEPEIIKHSPYYDNDKFIKDYKNKNSSFKILSLNCQCINAKIDEIKLFLQLLKENGCEF